MNNLISLHVIGTNPLARADIVSMLQPQHDMVLTTIGTGEGFAPTIAVAVADTVDAAVRLFHQTYRDGRSPHLVIVAPIEPSPTVHSLPATPGWPVVRHASDAAGDLVAAVRNAATQAADVAGGPAGVDSAARDGARNGSCGAAAAAERSARPELRGVSERERQILALVASGNSNAEIATALGHSEHTVKNIMYDLMARLDLRNRTHAAAFAVRNNLC
jgi:DNA-binding NarL/FixJ family response regulator